MVYKRTKGVGVWTPGQSLPVYDFFLVILGDFWKEIVFLKGLVKFGEIRNIKI